MSYQIEAVRAFNKIPIFSALTEDETFEIVRMCKIHRLEAGKTLFRQGEDGSSLYVIESGAVSVLLERDTGNEIVAKFGAYDVLGELALLDPGPRSATAVTTEKSVVYEVRGADFELLRNTMNPAAYKIIRALSRIVCKRIRSVNEKIEAQLAGLPMPAPHIGQSERATRKLEPVASTTASHKAIEAGGGSARPARTTSSEAVVKSSEPSGVFSKLLRRIWGGEE